MGEEPDGKKEAIDSKEFVKKTFWDIDYLNSDEEQSHFQNIKEWIHKNLKFNPHQYNDSYIKRRIQSRMFFLQMRSYRSYLELIDRDVAERRKLLNNLTVNVTRFFRNAPLYDEIKNVVIPEILSTKKPGEQIRIWSAGCASGEEPYSLAIMLAEQAGIDNCPYEIKIFATDIDSEAINKAVMGEYTISQLSETKPDIIDKYFRREGDIYVIDEKIKTFITFIKHDLFQDPMLPNMDLILCRNVVIYFTQQAKEELYLGFYNSLNKNGYYIIGKSETLTGEARQKFHFVNSDEKIYQKREV